MSWQKQKTIIRQKTVYETQHRNLKREQYKPNIVSGVISRFSNEITDPSTHVIKVMYIQYCAISDDYFYENNPLEIKIGALKLIYKITERSN